MSAENIDYEGLKRRGFLRQKQDGFFVLRAKMPHGVYGAENLSKIGGIAAGYGKGIVHATTRQGLEVPFIKLEDIERVEKELKNAGIEAGTSGPRLRTTTTCPGNNWCKSGLIDTFSLYDRIERDLGIRCGMELPHKFKIAISGCPNACTRPQASEIGVHGQVDITTKKTGYAIYIGGCAGRAPRNGFKLDRIFTEDEVLAVVDKTVKFFKDKAKPKERLALLIDRLGKDGFLKEIVI